MTKFSRRFSFFAALSLCGSTLSPLALAETVAIPLGQQGDHWNIERPATGLTKDQVIAKYGEPLEMSTPVGNPPISVWVYDQFNVYFEYDHVVHSVVIKK